ncbi:DUF3597 family protein, partial [Paraburkholderia bengalensis]|uniref:DUF3597 family protein n=1 Tax=Paraburkholderia bengalensis TaxID=2747562 RepID=UPI00301538CB
LEHRKALAGELKYGGDMNDSASMNIWLHKQLISKPPQKRCARCCTRSRRASHRSPRPAVLASLTRAIEQGDA